MDVDLSEKSDERAETKEIFLLTKATHHLLKFTCASDSESELKNWLKIVRQTVVKELKINILKSSLNINQKLMYSQTSII